MGFVRIGGGSFPAVQTAGPSKYDSIHTMLKSQKIEKLKDTKLNPYLIKDGYDSLAHAYYLWTQVGKKAKDAPNISFDEQAKIASNFYDKIIGPAYGQLKSAPMNKDLWMKQAYDQALNYQIEDAYNNDWAHGVRTGWNSGLAATARAAGTISTMLGNAVDDTVALWKKQTEERAKAAEEFKRTGKEPDNPDLHKSWHEQFADLHKFIASVPHEQNLIARGAVYQDAKHQFWADALPTHDGFINKMTSFVAEQAGNAPVYAAMMLGGEGLGIAGGGNLTSVLSKTAVGKHALGLLLAGGEGLAYGAATHKQDDPGEAWRDAVGFAVFHGAFKITGAVGGKILAKLIDMFPQGSKEWLELKKRQDLHDLKASGQTPDNAVQLYNKFKTEVANNLGAVGVAGQRAIHVASLNHVHATENMSEQQVQQYEARMLKDDPAHWSPVFAGAKFIKSVLNGRKLSEMTPEMEEELNGRFNKLVTDAAGEMNTRVKDMQVAREAQAEKTLKQPSAKHTLDYYVKQVQAEVAKNPGTAALVSKEQIMKAAAKRMADDMTKAAEVAEEETGAPPTEKAVQISKRLKPAMKVHSERVVKGKDVSVRYQVTPDYKVRWAQHVKAAKTAGKELGEYFQDLSDEDFEKDMSQYFYPKSLQKAEVFFEHQNTREGMQNPNFLAFMLNYKEQMPKEFGQELQNRLIDTMKVQKYMKGRSATEPQLLYYAKAMYNHVDNFLGSGRWPNESNLFRTTQENMFKGTKWQRQLLIEKTLQEQKNLMDAFSNDPKAKKLALATHAKFSQMRLREFDTADIKHDSQTVIKGYDDAIADLITANKVYDKWSF